MAENTHSTGKYEHSGCDKESDSDMKGQKARNKLKGTHMEEKIFLQNNFLEIKMS
jgi:hypothetical protein